MSEWIKCSEQLPEEWDYVLVYRPQEIDGRIVIASEIIDTAEFQGDNELNYQWFTEGHGYVTPTHWMPLPDAPKPEEKK